MGKMREKEKSNQSSKEKIKKIKKQIEETAQELFTSGKASTELEFNLGDLFNDLKKAVKKKKKEWAAYLEENFPYFTVRTIQRYMRLNKKIDLGQNPQLAFAGQTRLLDLLSCVPKNEDVFDFLKTNRVDLKFDPRSPEAVNGFCDEIDKVIAKVRKEKKSAGGSKKPSLAQSISRIQTAAISCRQVIKLAKEDAGMLQTVKAKTIDKAIENVGKLMEQLKKIKSRLKSAKTEAEEE